MGGERRENTKEEREKGEGEGQREKEAGTL
jgi:hypothetical protein